MATSRKILLRKDGNPWEKPPPQKRKKAHKRMPEFRDYQAEANMAACEELTLHDKCIVKMFCGTGKSLVMRRCDILAGKPLVVFVFPSLSLIDQFYSDYLFDFDPCNILKISSEMESTTDPEDIVRFLGQNPHKIICITYQSFGTLIDNLGDVKIDVCIFDEAHHAVGETYQKLIFENDVCMKQVFFTATPKNANGIVMCNEQQSGMCGRLVYDYSYLRGMFERYLNPFEIRIDLFSENTNRSIMESIARAVLASGNGRVLTFHSDVNTDRDTSVMNFVDSAEFSRVFEEIQAREFPQITKWRRVAMIGLTAAESGRQRRRILDDFDATADDCVMVVSSCETIGEGVDTKNANMCVFVDPKTSYVKIIQNIGRIVRKQKQISTILIPCWVDKTKYLGCGDDREKRDEVIREDMGESGNFNGILNVMSALKQEDEELYELCLHYLDAYSPQEVESNLEYQGYMVDDIVGEGGLFETVEYLLDTDDLDWEDDETEEEALMRVADENGVCVEIHTTSLENPVERYNSGCGEVIRLYRETEDDEEVVYRPVVRKDGGTKRNIGRVEGPNRRNRLTTNVHASSDIRVLWNVVGDVDLTKDVCSCVIDCEVVRYDPMDVARGIVERGLEREKNGGKLLPRKIYNKQNRTTPALIQETKDASKLGAWKQALKGQGASICPDAVRDYLDAQLPGWRTEKDFYAQAMIDAQNIVGRAKERDEGERLPRHIQKKNQTTPALIQEAKDAHKLQTWKQALKGQGEWNCPDAVRDYLDAQLPGWRTEKDFYAQAMIDAQNIVGRAKERDEGERLPRKIQKKNQTTPALIQEAKDAQKLQNWKQALKKQGTSICPDAIRDYLDTQLPGWRTELDEQAMIDAQNIVGRAKERGEGQWLPRKITKNNQTTPALIQEAKDAQKLGDWKKALKGQSKGICPDAVRDYLDAQLPGWRTELDEQAMIDAQNIVGRAKERDDGQLLPRYIIKKNQTTPALIQEAKDAQKLGTWKMALKGQGTSICPDAVRDYLDEQLPGWRTEKDFYAQAMIDAQNIMKQAKEREKNGGRLLPRNNIPKNKQTTPALIQETKDAIKLQDWKKALKGKGRSICPDAVRDYLDENLPGWRATEETPPPKKSMKLPASKPQTQTPIQRPPQAKAELSILHQRYKTMNSANLHAEFNENPDLWNKYHQISEENEKTFPEEEIPRNRIIQELDKIQTKRTKLVVDMGCGKAQIANHFLHDKRFQFINYDHVSSSQNITTCDIAHIPLGDAEVEICILSLAMWGSNCRDYVGEANRVLESGGRLYVVEPTKRWSTEETVDGSRLRLMLEETGFQIVEQSVAKFAMFVCLKV